MSDCVFFYKLNANCVFYPAVMGELMSAHPSLLKSTVVTDSFYPSLMYYHCSDILVARIDCLSLELLVPVSTTTVVYCTSNIGSLAGTGLPREACCTESHTLSRKRPRSR
jgi:hypothetical protein